MRRVGILGGTFQPIHNGHLEMARLARRQLGLDKVVFMIAGQPPHKTMQGDATDRDRLEMVRLSIADEPGFSVDTRELEREGPSYTVDTLREWKAEHPCDELYFILGSDMLRYFPHWREPHQVAALTRIACITRAGQSGGEAEAKAAVEREYGGTVLLLGSVKEVSSTEVRERVSGARPIGGLVPDGVAGYIYQHMLYQPPDIEGMYQMLSRALPPKRLAHSLSTVQRAVDLAGSHGCDPEQARLAALLHDCAKQLPPERLAILSGEDPVAPSVLHAGAGAVLARNVYRVRDDAVLRAIRLHTTGDRDMTVLDKVIYLADISEPTRCHPSAAALREEIGLDRAMLLAIESTLCYIQERGLPLHPATLRAYRSLGGQA